MSFDKELKSKFFYFLGESGGVGIGVRRGRGQSKKVKLQTRAITEVMYTAYSFVTTKGSLVIFFWQNTCKLGKKIS